MNCHFDIGGFHYPITTDSTVSQTWFDRGLAMCFAFHHEEAVRCFERALQADPGCAMALWGIAYAWGPNINAADVPPHQLAQAAIAVRWATLHTARSTPLERDLIEALAQRYATPVPEDRTPLNQAYADVTIDRSCYCRQETASP